MLQSDKCFFEKFPKPVFSKLLLTAVWCILAVALYATPVTLTVTGTGTDENDALLSAFRNAVRQGCGFYMRHLTAVNNDEISDRTSDFFAGGKVLKHKIVQKTVNSAKQICIVAEVTVSPASLGISGATVKNGRVIPGNMLNIVQQIEHINSALAALSQIWDIKQADNLYSIELDSFKFRVDQQADSDMTDENIQLTQKIRFSLIADAYTVNVKNTLNILLQYAEKRRFITYDDFLQQLKKYRHGNHQTSRLIFIAEAPGCNALIIQVNEKIFTHLKEILQRPGSVCGTFHNEKTAEKFNFMPLDCWKFSAPVCYTVLNNAIFIHPFLNDTSTVLSQNCYFPYALFADTPALKVSYCYFPKKLQKITAAAADDGEDIEVTVSGWGETAEAAKVNAVKEAIVQAVGSYLDAHSLLTADTVSQKIRKQQESAVAGHREFFHQTTVSKTRGGIKSLQFFNLRQVDNTFICDAKVKVQSARIKEFLRQPHYSLLKTARIAAAVDQKQQNQKAAKKVAMAIFRYTRESIQIDPVNALQIKSGTDITDGMVKNINAELTLKINSRAYWKMLKTLLPLLDKYCKKRGTISANKMLSLAEKEYGKWDIAVITAVKGTRYTAVYYTMPEVFKSYIFSCFYYEDERLKRFPQSIKAELCFKNGSGEVKSRSVGDGDMYPLLIKENSIFLAPAIFKDKERAYREIYIGMTCHFKVDDFKDGDLKSSVNIYYDFDANALITSFGKVSGERVNRMPLSVYPTQMKMQSKMNKHHSGCDWENAAFRNFSAIQKEYFYFCRRQMDVNNNGTNEYLRSIGWKHSGLGFIPAHQSKNGKFAIFAVSPQQKLLTISDKVTTFNGKSFLLVTDLLAYLKTLDAGDTIKVQSSAGIFTVTLQPLESTAFDIRRDSETQP